MAVADGGGLYIAVGIASASPHETRLVASALEQSLLPWPPDRMIGDRADDSDP
jgi:hypothetical protein